MTSTTAEEMVDEWVGMETKEAVEHMNGLNSSELALALGHGPSPTRISDDRTKGLFEKFLDRHGFVTVKGKSQFHLPALLALAHVMGWDKAERPGDRVKQIYNRWKEHKAQQASLREADSRTRLGAGCVVS